MDQYVFENGLPTSVKAIEEHGLKIVSTGSEDQLVMDLSHLSILNDRWLIPKEFPKARPITKFGAWGVVELPPYCGLVGRVEAGVGISIDKYGNVRVAGSFCHPKDRFTRKEAIRIAKERLEADDLIWEGICFTDMTNKIAAEIMEAFKTAASSASRSDGSRDITSVSNWITGRMHPEFVCSLLDDPEYFAIPKDKYLEMYEGCL